MMSNTIQNRSELIFLYDIKDTNPNGDPLDENKPRIDEITEECIVTDVRLKRTIRDYLDKFKGKDIFVKEKRKGNGKLETKKQRIQEINKSSEINMKEKPLKFTEEVVKKYIDLRLFGATIAVKNSTITRIGPVQFNFGRSLHKITPQFIKGTTVMPSRADKVRGTFTELYVVPYGLIKFYGIINENAAKDTGLSESDVKLLLEGLWQGTKNLITRSKVGQIPRVLIRIIYKEDNFHLGDLDKSIKLINKKEDKQIRSTEDYKLDLSEFSVKIKENKDKIAGIEYKIDKAIEIENLDWKCWNDDFTSELKF